MPRKSDTHTRVFETADTLLLEGIRPTQQNIRERIGSGSISTINKALNEWWQSIGERLKAQRERPDLPGQVIESANKMWQQSLAYAERALYDKAMALQAEADALRECTEHKIEGLQSELGELRSQNARLLQESERQSADKRTLQQSLLEHEERLIRLSAERDNLNRELKQQALLSDRGRSGLSTVTDEEYMNLRVALGIAEQECERYRRQTEKLSDENAQLRLTMLEQERAATTQQLQLEKQLAKQELLLEQLQTRLDDGEREGLAY